MQGKDVHSILILIFMCHCGLVAKSCPTLVTPWTVARQPCQGFPGQEYLSGLPFPSPRGSSQPRIKPGSPALQMDSLPTE